MARMHGSSTACVHALESSDDGSNPSHRSKQNGKVPSKEIKKRTKKLLMPMKQKWRIFRSCSRTPSGESAAPIAGVGEEISDAEMFVSADNSELLSFCTDNGSEFPSFRLSPLIFPIGIVPAPAASPVKIVQKLPFGYVIGRQLDASTPPPSALTLERSFGQMIPVLADLRLRSRLRMIKRKAVCALKERFGRHSPQGKDGGAGEGDDLGQNDDGDRNNEDAFWKKDVRGLRCRRVDNNAPY